MMKTNWKMMLVALPLMATAAACSDKKNDRDALQKDEMDRNLDLALQSDSATPVTYQDTALSVDPVPDPKEPPRPSPRPAPRTPMRDPTPSPTPRPRATQPVPAPAPRPSTRTVTSTAPSGSSMSLTLNETLSTERNQIGDSFTATVQSDIRGENGEVVIPAGATVRGRLTQVDKSGRVGQTGIIKVAFESVSFGGRSYPLDATVVRANPERHNRQTTAQTATKIGAGAAAGAILGRVIGKNTKSTVKGAVIGAAAGTAIAMGTADVDVVLPAGSEMVVTLDSPIEVRRTVSN
jgi:hypothetical protein